MKLDKLIKKLIVFILIISLLSSCAVKDNGEDAIVDERSAYEKEYLETFEGLGYGKCDNAIAVNACVSEYKDPDFKPGIEWFLMLLNDEESDYYKSSSEIAIVIATKISSETFVKDTGYFRNEEGNIVRDKRVVTATKMRVDEIPEIIKTSGNSLNVGDYFYILEYRGEYSTKDEVVYENGMPYALDPTPYRAIQDGPSICFVNFDDKPITVSGYNGDDEFTGWWKCSWVSIEKRVFSENNIVFDSVVGEAIGQYAWHLAERYDD